MLQMLEFIATIAAAIFAGAALYVNVVPFTFRGIMPTGGVHLAIARILTNGVSG